MHRSLFFSLLALTFALATNARAQEGGATLRVGGGMVVDFGGEADYGPGRDDDLEATLGLRAHLDYDVARYVSIGGFTRLTWWEGEDLFEERNLIFDLGPRIAGHFDYRDFRFYVAAMPGLVLSKMNNEYDGVDNPAAGFTMSIAPGVEYWFNGDLAVYTEFLGWVGHYFDHDYEAGSGETSIFIRPPNPVRSADLLVTNFHLPRSTLVMLVAAFAGYELTMTAYDTAVREGYRFYSYGDAMLLV